MSKVMISCAQCALGVKQFSSGQFPNLVSRELRLIKHVFERSLLRFHLFGSLLFKRCLVQFALFAGLCAPTQATLFNYHDSSLADVVIGTDQYFISDLFGTGLYLGPTPEEACSKRMAEMWPEAYAYHSVTDLGGNDVYSYSGPEYYHNYYCNAVIRENGTVVNFNMSRGPVACPAPTYALSYLSVREGYGELIPPLDVNACILFLPAESVPPENLGGDGGCKGSPKDVGNIYIGNPINAGVGDKFQSETDYAGFGTFPLTLTRSYNSAYAITNASNGVRSCKATFSV